ncbi:MAG: CBS domain-containing protein [Candidatus Aenigmarchaeota archaeon]|nr:CBS domain-containing protein [Candidatus Aenigmarchaeota archaeon]MCX8190623.1 CBS domain-containing protein [Candidatus Aenigmarchaeota archaeon]MDW8160166.1 CBS domain-containing protein [Candidatus Aenigmarchaeota archaeon]
MLVKDVMNKNVVVAKPTVTLREASKVMGEMNMGSLVIMEDEKIVGIVTSTDILKAIGDGKDPDKTTTQDIMSREIITIQADEEVCKAVEIMVKHKIKRLPVMMNDKLVGIITVSDIAIIEPKIIREFAALLSLNALKFSGA